MDDIGLEDDKKKFDTEGPPDEETQPDPEEELMLDRGNGRVWLVKVRRIPAEALRPSYRFIWPHNFSFQIPKHLMTRWASIDKDNVHLATIRIYQNAVSPSGRSPRIFLFLPPDPNDPTPRAPELPEFASDAAYIPGGEGGVHVDRYELDMVNSGVENQLVIAERPKHDALPPSGADAHNYNPRARTTILTGHVKHDCNLRPLFNESYRRQMRERSRAYNTPKRQIRMIEEAGVTGGRGGINRLSSGINSGSFADMIVGVVCVIHVSRIYSFSTEIQTKACQRDIRTHGSYASESAIGFAVPAFPRATAVEYQTTAGTHATARSLSQRGIGGHRDATSQWRVQWVVGTVRGICTRWGGFRILSTHRARDNRILQVKAENVPGPSSQTSGVDTVMEDYDEEEEDDDMEEVS